MASPLSPSSRRDLAGRFRLFLWLLVLVGVVAGVRSASHRWQVENSNRRVEIALDFAEVRSLASASGVSVADVLRQFKAAGATSVAVQEETVAGLEESRRIRVMSADTEATQLADFPSASGTGTAIIARVSDALGAKTGIKAEASEYTGEPMLSVNAPWQTIRGVGVGLDPETINAVRGAGLGIVGRVGNYNGVTPDGLAWTLKELKAQGASTVLFSGDEVLGYKGYIARPRDSSGSPSSDLSPISTEYSLRTDGLFYGAIEFGKQKGDAELSKAAPDRTVRVHTIPGAEMLTISLPDAVQRFSLAVRERNIRLLFVRLFLDEPNAVSYNTAYVGKIAAALKRGHLTTGTAHGYGDLGVGFTTRLVIGLAILAGTVLLADSVTRFLEGGVSWTVGVGAGLVGFVLAVLAASPLDLFPFGVKLAALAAALIFPSLGLLAHDLLHNEIRFGAWGRFAFACVVTGFGIVCVIGLLVGTTFLVKADAFVGIKATLAVPLLLVGAVYALDLRARDDRTFPEAVRLCQTRLGKLLQNPVLVWQIVAVGIALVLVYVILSRSGNESGVGVSGAELKIRALLDRFLGARPRFKDVCGHAALMLSLLLYARTRKREWVLPLFLLGAVGQTSLLNTFCHLHTPIAVSLWRAGLGIVIGAAFGAAAFALVNRFVIARLPKGTFG